MQSWQSHCDLDSGREACGAASRAPPIPGSMNCSRVDYLCAAAHLAVSAAGRTEPADVRSHRAPITNCSSRWVPLDKRCHLMRAGWCTTDVLKPDGGLLVPQKCALQKLRIRTFAHRASAGRPAGPPSPTQGILIMARYVTVQATFGFGEKIMIERAREPAKRSASPNRKGGGRARGARLWPGESLTEIGDGLYPG